MDYIYERNITEIKLEYTTFLMNILTPFIYEGIKSVYVFALNAHTEFVERGKYDPEVKSPGVLKIFQLSLKEIPTLNNNTLDIETNRIKSGCKCSDWFDDLVKAVIKSNIVLLSFTNHKRKSKILKEDYHNKINVKDFIHKCYIESARLIYCHPELFWHEYATLEIKRNQRETFELIKQAIQEAIRKMLPIKLILTEYLSEDYVDNDDDVSNMVPSSQYENVKKMVQKDLHEETNPHEHEHKSSDGTSDSGETESGSESVSKLDSEQEHKLEKDFLEEIESKLHSLDGKIDVVNKVPTMPSIPAPTIQNENSCSDVTANKINKIFEEHKSDNDQKKDNINEFIKPSPVPPLDGTKPPKLTKKDQTLMDELNGLIK